MTALGTRAPVTAARGPHLRCRGWRQEGLLRMLENVLEVGEDPANLVVYASFGKAARDWDSYRAIVDSLMTLGDDETLVLQSGRPVAVLPLGPQAPRVLSAVNNAVGRWQDTAHFDDLSARGLTMWGGLTAAAWQYIGSQGVLQGAYELFRAVAAEHFGGSWQQRWLVTSGLGGMGSAQPLAATLAGASCVVVEVDRAKLDQAHARGLLDEVVTDLGVAVRLVQDRLRQDGPPLAVGLLGNVADVVPALVDSGVVPDVVTDMTAAHDLRRGYVPTGMSHARWRELRETDPAGVAAAAAVAVAAQVRAMLVLRERGAVVFENGNNLRAAAAGAGVDTAFTLDGFMERYLRPLFCRAIGPFRWVALSGDPADLAVVDDLVAGLVPERPEVARWIGLARGAVRQQGLPARSCWLGHGERSRVAVAVDRAVADGRLSAPVLFTRDHLDAAGMTHPRIGTEGMLDGSDGITDFPLLDALAVGSSGADLVAVHSGGGGYSGWMQSAGVSVVADGSPGNELRLRRVLDADTALGVVRYAEAGYATAAEAATAARIARPMADGQGVLDA